jgi:hypothetical protein
MIMNFYPLLIEAALRALLAAFAVWMGLRALQVANVVVLKAAWAVVLVAAVALPFAPKLFGTPSWAALNLPAMSSLEVQQNDAVNSTGKPIGPAAVSPAFSAANTTTRQADSALYSSPSISDSQNESAAIADVVDEAPAAVPSGRIVDSQIQSAAQLAAPASSSSNGRSAPIRLGRFLLLLYFGVTFALVLRLLIGLGSAIALWLNARPISMLRDPGWKVRYSARVASPVNIGSGIVLPAEYSEWDEEKLRIVLAHERSHIRQGDFYLQLLAGLYTAIFWFSPLGWWLKRKLYELGEAISDRAGLEEAASRTSYAQLLLEFAALPRPTLTGVAMARTSHLSQRIERLLNESSFRQAFAATGRRALLAIILVPLAILTATSLVTVQAARPSTQTAPAALAGQSTPEQVTDAAPQAPPAAAPAPVPAAAPEANVPEPAPAPAPAPAPEHDVVVIPPPAAPDDANGEHVIVIPHVHVAPHAMVMPQIAAIPPMPPMPPMAMHINPRDFAFAYGFGQDGDPYAVVGSDGKVQRPRGWFFNDSDRNAEIDKARQQAHGAFLWFQHEGKSYVIEDPNVLSQVEAMNKPMDDLQTQMHDLSKQMRELGQQQREKAKSMRDTAVQTPDLSKALAELKTAQDALQAKQGGTITQKELGDLQREIGRIQGELGSLQGKMAMDQAGIGKMMGEFGEQQGKLGGQMGKLGAEMGRIARENHEKIDGIIKDSLSNGKAKQVE